MIMSPKNIKPGSNYDLTIVTRSYMYKKAQLTDASELGQTICIWLMGTGGKDDGFYASTTTTVKDTEFVWLQN